MGGRAGRCIYVVSSFMYAGVKKQGVPSKSWSVSFSELWKKGRDQPTLNPECNLVLVRSAALWTKRKLWYNSRRDVWSSTGCRDVTVTVCWAETVSDYSLISVILWLSESGRVLLISNSVTSAYWSQVCLGFYFEMKINQIRQECVWGREVTWADLIKIINLQDMKLNDGFWSLIHYFSFYVVHFFLGH